MFQYANTGVPPPKPLVKPENVPVVSAYERRKKDGDMTSGMMSPPVELKVNSAPRDYAGKGEEQKAYEISERYSNFAMTTRGVGGKEAFFNSTVNISKTSKSKSRPSISVTPATNTDKTKKQ